MSDFRVRRVYGLHALIILALLAILEDAPDQPPPVPTLFLPLVSDTLATPNGRVIPDGYASWSAPIAVSPRDGTVWVVNPDSDSISVLDGETLAKRAELAVGDEPRSLAIAPDGGAVFVANRAAGTITAINARTYALSAALTVGLEPAGLALNPTGDKLYVALMLADRVAVVDVATWHVVAGVPVSAKPYAVAVSDDGDVDVADERIYVTHLLGLPRPGSAEAADNSRAGVITVLDAASTAVSGTIVLSPNAQGFPNLLAAIALHADRAWLPHVRDAPALPNGLTTTVFAAVSTVDLASSVEAVGSFLPLNDQEVFGSPVNNPAAAIPAPDGKRLYVVLGGSDLVEVIDISTPARPRLMKFLPVGKNPQGLALSVDGGRGYVMNYLSRSVSMLDLAQLAPAGEVTVTGETLPPDVLRGKILFYNASSPRLSQGSWISCASCHFAGLPDGVTWIFPDGPRQTPALWRAGDTLPWHWSAALDEPQDVEATIQIIQHGLGLAPGADPPELGLSNQGRSADLDALAAYIVGGVRVPAASSSAMARGRESFRARGCDGCHGGPHWTASMLPGAAGSLDVDGNGMVDAALRDVGSVNALDQRGATGFDPPSLLGAGFTAPYLHDGAQPTLEALLLSGHPSPGGDTPPYSAAEVAALSAFVRSITADTPAIHADE